jgi:hypothetical protein
VVKCSWVKCEGVLQCSDGLSNKVSNIIRRLMDNMKVLLISILRVLLSYPTTDVAVTVQPLGATP